MIIHYSILGIIILVSFFWNGAVSKNKCSNYYSKQNLTPWVIIFGYIAFLAAMRTSYNDTSLYISSFENCVGGWEEAKKILTTSDLKYALTDFLQSIFKGYISDNYHAWFALFSVIESIIFIYVYRRECNDIFIPCYYFFTSVLYVNYFSMMRQWMAVSIMFIAVIPFKEKKWIKFFICCFLAFLVHPSAILCVAFYFLALGQPWKLKQVLILSIASVAILFADPLLNNLVTSMEGTTYDYALNTMNSDAGSSPIRAIIAFVPVILSFLCRDKIANENNKIIDLSVNLSVFFFLLNLVASFTSGLYVVRLATYLAPFIAILYSYLFTKGLNPQLRKYILPAFIVLYFAYYVYAMNHQGESYYISDVLGTFK